MDYAEIAQGALESLQDAGQAMVLSVPGAGTYSPSSATVASTPSTYPCTGVLLPAGQMAGRGFSFAADVLVQAQALVFLAATGLAVRPVPGCTLTIQGEAWRVLGADTLSPAGVPVLHALAVSR
jgi:hypothetical protein